MYTDVLTDSYLFEYLGEAIQTLDSDEDGKRCIAEMDSILAEHPKLQTVMHNGKAVDLTEADAEALLGYLKTDNEKRTLEHWLCYKRGIVDGICMAKNSGKFK